MIIHISITIYYLAFVFGNVYCLLLCYVTFCVEGRIVNFKTVRDT